VLVTHRSLAAMAARRRGGAPVVVPFLLAAALSRDEPTPYTLRGFEAVEERVLGGAAPPAGEAQLLPLSLLAGDRAADLLATLGQPLAPELAAAAARAGLCHPFVDYYGEVRDDVLPFLPADARDVLEVGCGAGGTGRLLQERLGCQVTGVELNPAAAAAAASHLHRVVCGDVATADLEGKYDAVVALELFEHLPEAERVLSRLASLVRPGGRIVLSVPNVGHHSVVADLLAGRWDYLPIGLLCYTHYRFFTRQTLDDWLRRLGFARFALVPQTTELPAAFAGDWPVALDRESLATKGFWVLIDA
jgi:SAM-dependent methyltransferase